MESFSKYRYKFQFKLTHHIFLKPPHFWGSHQIPFSNSLVLSDSMKFINGKPPERLQVYNLLENFTSYAVLNRVENFG